MKKISIALFICLFSVFAFIACEKQSNEKEEIIKETFIQKEISYFVKKIEDQQEISDSKIIIYPKSKAPSKIIYNATESNYSDILGPIIEKLSTGVVTTTEEDGGPHGSADCKYCSKIGGMRCGNKIASQIPENAEEVHITISKKGKDGCRNIHAEW